MKYSLSLGIASDLYGRPMSTYIKLLTLDGHIVIKSHRIRRIAQGESATLTR